VKRAIRRAKIRVPQRSVMGFTMKKNGLDKKHPFCISLLKGFCFSGQRLHPYRVGLPSKLILLSMRQLNG
ncbi:MAG: hypothetical protein ABR955_09745, partial [Verrucomicrobiota bacterium]